MRDNPKTRSRKLTSQRIEQKKTVETEHTPEKKKNNQTKRTKKPKLSSERLDED